MATNKTEKVITYSVPLKTCVCVCTNEKHGLNISLEHAQTPPNHTLPHKKEKFGYRQT